MSLVSSVSVQWFLYQTAEMMEDSCWALLTIPAPRPRPLHSSAPAQGLIYMRIQAGEWANIGASRRDCVIHLLARRRVYSGHSLNGLAPTFRQVLFDLVRQLPFPLILCTLITYYPFQTCVPHYGPGESFSRLCCPKLIRRIMHTKMRWFYWHKSIMNIPVWGEW